MLVRIEDNTKFCEGISLVTQGCGCCECNKPATIFNIKAAIKEHEYFIVELKELLKVELLKQVPVQQDLPYDPQTTSRS